MVFANSYSEILIITTASFFAGWTLKNSRIVNKFFNLRWSPLMKTKLVIVVRSDLPMSKGKLAAQCSHAAVSCYRQGMKTCPEILETWMSNGEPKVIVRSDSPGEEGLKRMARKATEAGLVTAIIRDAGRTEVRPGTATVLGIGPGCAGKVDELTSHLKLL